MNNRMNDDINRCPICDERLVNGSIVDHHCKPSRLRGRKSAASDLQDKRAEHGYSLDQRLWIGFRMMNGQPMG